MEIVSLDHLVLTVADIDNTVSFYTEVLNFRLIEFADNRKALAFGNQKINLHQKGNEVLPNAKFATSGSADMCFVTTTDLTLLLRELAEKNVAVISGIVERNGALGKINSIYLRDPDGNLIELCNY